MTTKHTPGAWAHDGLCIFGGTEKRMIIASVGADKREDAVAERRANIDMMTFAPAVVQECTRPGGILWMAEEWFRLQGQKALNAADFAERLEAARLAIAKATGDAQ